ncbi:MAG: ISL3 family transposase [Actinobacteria bacterium]|nr:ISL3 family transposase [Actinomycetota bacterium]
MRATTAFNRLLALQGARVTDVLFGHDGVTVRVALRRRRAVCSGCGQVCLHVHDRALRRWRHLDLGGGRCHVEYRLRRVRCPDCGVRVEAVPWARPGARHTRDFEDLVAFCAQQMAKTPICALLRIGWETVGRIVERVVADQLDQGRLKRLVMVGVDEISYRRGQRYLTQVCDHQTGAIVWAKPGRDAATLQAFFDELGEAGRSSIEAISIDMNGGYEKAIRERQADDDDFDPEVCFDPFHVVQLAQRAVDDVRRAEWNSQGKSKAGRGRWVKSVRWSLLKAPEKQTAGQLAALHEVSHANKRLYRAFLLKEELRLLYHLDDRALAPNHLKAWLAWASRSKLRPFVKLARTIRHYQDGILAAIRLGLSNSRMEALNSKVRLLSHRSFGFHGPKPLIALIHLCCTGLVIHPPHR